MYRKTLNSENFDNIPKFRKYAEVDNLVSGKSLENTCVGALFYESSASNIAKIWTRVFPNIWVHILQRNHS